MGQVKGNPIPSAEHAAFEAKYPNTGRANRDLGQIIAVVEEAPIVIEEVIEVVDEIVKPAKNTSAKIEETIVTEEAPVIEETPTEEAPLTEEAAI
jgi:hypothetical protein